VRKSETFSTAEDGQTVVTVHVLQGERPMAADNMSLGQFNLEGIPPAARGVPQVEVTFDIDANGILNVTAKDRATGQEQQITITATTNLSEREIEDLVREAKRHESEDTRRKMLIDARNKADAMIYQIEKTLREMGNQISASDRGRIDQIMEDLKKAKEGNDADRINQLIDQLQQASYAIGQQMYAQQQGAAAGAQPGSAPGSNGGERGGQEEVVEGEFEEA
jgi:molecular chaperone DnaK